MRMLDQNKFRQDHQKAVDLMQERNLPEAGEAFRAIYAQLRMNTYRQRLSKRRFEKVFFGLTPDDVIALLVNKTACHMNASETKQALDSIRCYRMIGRDFSIHGALDFDMAMNEVECYRRSGENRNALRCCERLLKTTLEPYQKVDVLITKGSIETEENHNIFGINTLSEALAEAEAEGSPDMIAHC